MTEKQVYARAGNFVALCLVVSLVGMLCGCEAFVRKFTRKSKNPAPQEEMVLVPQEYKGPNMTKEEIYRQSLLYWKSWQDELLEALTRQENNQKKRLTCANEAIKNLQDMRKRLDSKMQGSLDTYLVQMMQLAADIQSDIYGNNFSIHHSAAERIRRQILKSFSYSKVAKDLL